MTSNRAPEHTYKFLHKKALFDGESQEVIDILQRSMRNVQEIIDTDECSIALLEPGESVLFIYSIERKSGEKTSVTHFQLDEESTRWLTQTPMTTNNAELAALFHLPIVSPISLSVPLLEHSTFLGMLSVRSSVDLDDHKTRMLSICADQVAMTISKMIEASDERQEVVRTKARFFSMITHELRSPLNSINGYLELVMSGAGGELNGQQYEFVQRARVGSEHLYALLENLLLISRMDNGQMRLNREIIRLQDVIETAVEELELSASDQNITIEVDNVDSIPKIYADPVRLRQVFRNLLGNALNFTPPGGRITISASRDKTTEKSPATAEDVQPDDEAMGTLKLQVHDTGVGIAPEYHKRIFERSFQAPTEIRGRAGGPGLGLTIVKMIVELHGGSVMVESELHQGSTFTCLLPCILP